jgi:hypothetical protein
MHDAEILMMVAMNAHAHQDAQAILKNNVSVETWSRALIKHVELTRNVVLAITEKHNVIAHVITLTETLT